MAKTLPFSFRDVGTFLIVVNRDNVRLTVNPVLQRVSIEVLKQPQFTRRDVVQKVVGDDRKLGSTADERYRNYLAKAKALPLAEWLFGNSDFTTAYELFKRKSKSNPDSSYAALQYAELEFLYCAGIAGYYALSVAQGNTPKSMAARERTSAMKRVETLRKSLTAGISTGSYQKDMQLDSLLSELLANVTASRKKRVDQTTVGRQFVETISLKLWLAFGEISPEIVGGLARVMGYDPARSSLEGQIRALKTKLRLTTPKKSNNN